ncbi:WYL domain-containing transcriptional regulator [Paenibacillus aurantius]|uniref:WYL domain-containing transcriptional regulator n=1 Tax=Paenibacillus aurantius TaxID=2918900 RepID=A0AA96LIX2_9BACL|nr:WYL domain-containing transcriptional regulator [Paenibacillus aurantius]WNQ14153.1 WYL domain-containing transcriptional regulator [Paenibacillus aurantius]
MAEKFFRWFRIVQAIQARPGITAPELADRCETDVRTTYRDLRALDSLVPITNEGYGKGYTFAGDFALYPFNWTEQEALVFSMLPSFVDRSSLPPGFDTAYDKVMASHLKQKRRDQDILQNVTDIIQMGSPAYKEESPNYLLPVIQAILAEKTISAVYHTQSRNELTERKIDPYYLVPRDQRFYLIGYCHQAEAIRTFRLSRFRRVEITKHFFRRGDFNLRQYMKNTWSIERGQGQISFKVRFSPVVARYVKEEELFVKPKMTDLPDGGLLFEVTLNHDREFLNWVFQYGEDAEILEPRSYRESMKERLAKWSRLYG